MMADVPTADVVVTNPTHYAVALKYADGSRAARRRWWPRASTRWPPRSANWPRNTRSPLLEAPALARALHKHTEIGDEIPEALYAAVAEVLAYVFQLRSYNKGARQASRTGRTSWRCRPNSIRTTPHRRPNRSRRQTRIKEHTMNSLTNCQPG